MSAERAVVLYGIRFEISESEIEALELRTDPRMKAARLHRLKTLWGNFGGDEALWLLFVGRELGALGWEDSAAFSYSAAELAAFIGTTDRALEEAGFHGEHRLHCWHEPDA